MSLIACSPSQSQVYLTFSTFIFMNFYFPANIISVKKHHFVDNSLHLRIPQSLEMYLLLYCQPVNTQQISRYSFCHSVPYIPIPLLSCHKMWTIESPVSLAQSFSVLFLCYCILLKGMIVNISD